MLLSFTCIVGLATAALARTSPLFLLASTADLPISPSVEKTNPPISHVRSTLWRSLAKCPTKHYAVVIEPVTLSYTTGLVPRTHNARRNYLAEPVDGQININHVMNTILMDCLHHGVLRGETLDTRSMKLPDLDQETIRKSIMYARMPEFDVNMSRNDYVNLMAQRRLYVEQIIEKYFHNQDYTLIYVREQEKPGREPPSAHEDDKEIPLVEDY